MNKLKLATFEISGKTTKDHAVFYYVLVENVSIISFMAFSSCNIVEMGKMNNILRHISFEIVNIHTADTNIAHNIIESINQILLISIKSQEKKMSDVCL